jgi:hypothetical protein
MTFSYLVTVFSNQVIIKSMLSCEIMKTDNYTRNKKSKVIRMKYKVKNKTCVSSCQYMLMHVRDHLLYTVDPLGWNLDSTTHTTAKNKEAGPDKDIRQKRKLTDPSRRELYVEGTFHVQSCCCKTEYQTSKNHS